MPVLRMPNLAVVVTAAFIAGAATLGHELSALPLAEEILVGLCVGIIALPLASWQYPDGPRSATGFRAGAYSALVDAGIWAAYSALVLAGYALVSLWLKVNPWRESSFVCAALLPQFCLLDPYRRLFHWPTVSRFGRVAGTRVKTPK